MLKFILKRFVPSKALTSRGNFKSKSTGGKDDVETTTPGSGEQPKMVHCRYDLSSSEPQSLSFWSGFDEFEFKRQCRELAGRCSLDRPTRFVDAVSSLFPLLQVGHIVGRRQPNFISLRSERARLQTFRDWQNAVITPLALAKNGFFFTGIADLVQCVFCRGVLGDWDSDEIPIPGDQYPTYRHRRQLPHCPFVRGFDIHNVTGGDEDELQGVENLRLEDELCFPVQEIDDHVVSVNAWNAVCREVFVGVRLRPSMMPLDWSVLGVHLRDSSLELSLSRLTQVDANNPDIRARFAAMLLNRNNMGVTYRTGTVHYSGHLGVTSHDTLLRDVIHLEHSIYSLMQSD